MRTVVVGLAVLLSFAGCVDQRDEAGPPPAADAVAPGSPAAPVHYSCPGRSPGDQPCGVATDALGLFGVHGLDVRDDGLVFVVGTSIASGVGTLPGMADPGVSVSVSSDQGLTWTNHLLPTVATESTRTGASTASFASIVAHEEAVVVLANMYPDPERRLLGGDPVPEPLQPRHDIAVFVSRDDGETWTTQLLATGGATYGAQAFPWPGGGIIASWWDNLLDAQVLRASRDLVAWGSPVNLPDCRFASLGWAGEDAVVACINDPDGFDVGDVDVVVLDMELAAVLGEATLDDVPDCTQALLLPASNGMLLFASGCPGLEFLASTDGLAWTRQAGTPYEDLEIDAYERNRVVDATLDDQGRVHALLKWAGTSAFCCTDEVNDHLVIDPTTGDVQHHVSLARAAAAANPEDLAVLAAQVAKYTEGEVHWSAGAGWLAWPGEPARVGLFSLG